MVWNFFQPKFQVRPRIDQWVDLLLSILSTGTGTKIFRKQIRHFWNRSDSKSLSCLKAWLEFIGILLWRATFVWNGMRSTVSRARAKKIIRSIYIGTFNLELPPLKPYDLLRFNMEVFALFFINLIIWPGRRSHFNFISSRRRASSRQHSLAYDPQSLRPFPSLPSSHFVHHILPTPLCSYSYGRPPFRRRWMQGRLRIPVIFSKL